MKAQQGHVYELAGKRVMAMSSGSRVTVADIQPERPYPLSGQQWVIDAADLKPLGMRYYGGVVPA